MTADQLTLYFNLFLGALILFGTLRGLIQGFKKSLFKLIKEAVYWAVFFLTADLIVGFLINSSFIFEIAMEIYPVSGEPATLLEYAQIILVQNELIVEGAKLELSLNFALALVSIVLKIAYLIVYLVIGRFIYWIITFIIWKCFVNRKKIEVKYEEKKLKNGKTKKKTPFNTFTILVKYVKI